ncbi:prephenate dehydratase [Naumannella cuiyingiana]|uniref:Prephenate dehydratase n=1 Tax=Naumannella cuiyingiana TaxID=1347891 RepID=A0A7Z0IL84_9ACTN|nr:prephenate dehydratase [Naumannella cuiyingiana]
MAIGYLGPEGTFTHQALLTIRDISDPQPFATVAETIAAVRENRVDSALVPIENSVEGGVTATLDNLARDNGLVIVGEVVLPVRFGIYARPGTELSAVRRVLTHPHAYAQCRDWLVANLPEAVVTEGGSTAAAAAEVADPDSVFDAAICAPIAGERHGLVALAGDIADNPDAVTRFVRVAPAGALPEPTGADKTTLVAYMFENHPGALLDILEQFASRGVSLTRLESRPTKRTLGDYCFSIDAEGHIRDARLGEAMMGLHRVCQRVVFLGSYPRADGRTPDVPRGSADGDYAAAREWLDSLD